jgi:hypothetical protein
LWPKISSVFILRTPLVVYIALVLDECVWSITKISNYMFRKIINLAINDLVSLLKGFTFRSTCLESWKIRLFFWWRRLHTNSWFSYCVTNMDAARYGAY